MKTKIILVLLLALTYMKANAKTNDSTAYNAGKIILSVGYGFPSIEKSLYGQHVDLGIDMSFSKSGYGPFHFRGEYGLTNKIGIGISINYDTYSGMLKESGFNTNTITSLTGLMRFNYHFATTKKLDPYFAVGAGFRSTTNTFTSTNPQNSFADDYNNWVGDYTPYPFAFEAVAGMRYYFTPHIGIYSEIGIAKSIIQFGVSVGF